MKLARIRHEGDVYVGAVGDGGVTLLGPEAVAAGQPLVHTATALGWAARGRDGAGPTLALDEVELLAPVARPSKFLAIGLNYPEHAAEAGLETPDEPQVFNKQVSSITGPHDPIVLPRVSTQVDYEGELGLVIGRTCRDVSVDQAREAIAGYLVVNDVSVRDWQYVSPTMTLGKSFDTHGPIGPWLVTPDEIGDPHDLRLRTYVNGELRQDSVTKLFFSCYEIVSYISRAVTLEPGDVITTGTPQGVAVAMAEPKWLVAGDVVRVEIDGIGVIENRVVAHDARPAASGG